MKIKPLELADLEDLQIIHDEFYRDEFAFPDFGNKFLSTFVVIDDNDDIIVGGGVRSLAEAIIMTDMSKSTRDRRKALYHVFQASLFTANQSGYNQLHAFVQNARWARCLKKIGFRNTVGQPLVITL